MALETELDTFHKTLPQLLSHEGEFVLIHGDKVDSFWPTCEAALDAGYARFNLEPFLVKEVVQQEKPLYFSRSVTRCR